MAAGHRIERDFLGEVEVPVGALYGIRTVRALANFALGGPTMADRPGLVVALVRVKVAAARANAGLDALDGRLAKAIVEAGRRSPTGGGTTSSRSPCSRAVAEPRRT